MRKEVRAVALAVLVAVGVVVAGVASSSTGLPDPRGRDAYTAPWRDGAKFLRVQHLGQHFAIVTISEARVIGSLKVTERSANGAYLAERNLILMADEAGIAQLAGEQPTREWWDRFVGIQRGVPRDALPLPKLPSAETRGGSH